MDEAVVPLLAVSGVADLADAVAAWARARSLSLVGVWSFQGGRKRRLAAVGLPGDWHLPMPPAAPWLDLSAHGTAPAPDLPGAVLHPLTGAGGDVVGAVLLPEGAREGAYVRALGLVVERVLAVDATRQRAGLFDELAALTRDGVLAANVDGDLLAYSPSLEALTGWSTDDVRRHGWTNLVYTDPAVRADVQRGIAALLRGWPSEGVVRTLARKDGTEVRMAIWTRVVRDPGGGPPVVLAVFRDVTTDEETRRRSAREEGLAQLGRIAGRIAHEYNNLLCAVMGHAELIEATSGLPDPVVRRASTIVRSARRGAHLSSRLLAFTGTAQPRPEPVVVSEVIEQVRELYGPRLPARVRLEVVVDGAPGRAEVDPTLLQQAVMNLVVNAAESMRFGGLLQVRVRESALPEDVSYLAPGAPTAGTLMVEVRVSDEGPGFSQAAFEHLFEPFFTEKSDGHGMGLPAVRGMLAAHGGAARVDNGAPPTGAVFTIWLPRSTRPELMLADLPRPSASLPRRAWILDDQDAVLEFSRVALEAAGVTVEVFRSLAALAAAPLEQLPPPDLLVFDVQLSDGDGPTALRLARERGVDAPVLWITGHTPDTLVMPAGPVLRKPYTGADLLHAVAGR